MHDVLDILEGTDIPSHIRQWIINNTKVTSNVDIAGVTFEDGKYTLLIGDNMFRLSPEARALILRHEILHVIRGDCLALAHDKKLHHMLFNIATDAVINRDLRADMIIDQLPDLVLYDDICDKAGLPPNQFYTSSLIYDRLKNNLTKINAKQDIFTDGGSGDVIDDLMDHTKTVKEIEAAIEKDKEDGNKPFLSINKKERKTAGIGAGQLDYSPKETKKIILIRDIEQWLEKSNGSIPLIKRGYKREGHNDLLPSYYRIARNKKLNIYVDVSGSTEYLWDVYHSTIKYLERKYVVRTFVFDDGVRELKDTSTLGKVGGGTTWKPIRESIEYHNARKAIVFTDGWFFDTVELPNYCDVLFVIPKGGNDLLPGTKIYMEVSQQ